MNARLAHVVRWVGDNRAWVALAAVVVVAGIGYDNFLTVANIVNVLRQATVMGLLAAGMTFVIVTRGIDLSVGSTLALGGIAYAAFAPQGVIVALVAALIVGATCGLVNALMIVGLNIDPFVATIASMFGLRGVALVLTGEEPVRIDSSLPGAFVLGRETVVGVPVPVIILLIVFLALAWAARSTRTGRAVYAVGGNASGAVMMGLPVARARTSVYVVSGLLASVAGVLLASRIGSGQPTAGDTYDLTAIAAVIIGGTLLSGGVGRLSGSLAGALLIAVIANVFNLGGQLSTWWQNALNGGILLALIVTQAAITQLRGRRQMSARAQAMATSVPSNPRNTMNKESSEHNRQTS